MPKEGKDFVKKPYTVMVAMDHDYDKGDDDDYDEDRVSLSKDSGTDKTLFSMLKDLRKTIAKKKNLPPFVIFQDPSLEDMAIHPVTLYGYKSWTIKKTEHQRIDGFEL